MTLDEMTEKALARVKKDNPKEEGFKGHKVDRILENIMDGTLVTVGFETATGKKDHNVVHFGPNEMRPYRGLL